MWSASTWYAAFQPSASTAASAAARVLEGAEPTVVCSRCDLFQTGTTGAPFSAASIQARNCAFAWCAKRSPMPNENFPRVNGAFIFVIVLRRQWDVNCGHYIGRDAVVYNERESPLLQSSLCPLFFVP